MKREFVIHGDTYPVASKLRRIGCRWDRELRAWVAPNRNKYKKAKDIVFKNDRNEGSTMLTDWSKQRSVQNIARRSART